MSAESLTRVAEGLIEAANSHRDGSVNRLYDLDRESERNTARLGQQVGRYVAVRERLVDQLQKVSPLAGGDLPAAEPEPARERESARFDPEAEWDVAGRAEAAPQPPAPPARRGRSYDDEEDEPDTWLR